MTAFTGMTIYMTKLSIIIISYNTPKLITDCLDSVTKNLPGNSEIIVIDNNSDPETLTALKQFPQIKLIKNSQNIGFAGANNQGVAKASGQYLLFLNSDTLVKPGSLQHLIDFFESHPNSGIVSPQILNADQAVQSNGGSLPNIANIAGWMLFIDDLPVIKQIFPSYHQKAAFFRKSRSLGWVSGAALAIRREVVDQIGGWDEKIFMYGEDIDLCFRARKANWQVYTYSSSQIVHLGQGSGSQAKALVGEMTGLIYLFKKYYPRWIMPILVLILRFGTLLRIVLFGKIRKHEQLYAAYSQAFKLVGRTST
jgi:GT2 family glycosyltransferase